ncbi:DoxX family protein [Marivirga arenosa]|uniref:DoxX family protein n=1 Tax=Marivirga arenosa TaxID=3059076 RepID=A0AA49GGF9_9BACT|nr:MULTISPECIES: hypothetical protein [unclassified Marivirga]WKK80500.1 hypothetical protein QYS47_25745 [Marivirga sp. BKB1-2]WKK84531.1 hypothetical protein QYS48_20610 [Marivirga sp. ABR2-2]
MLKQIGNLLESKGSVYLIFIFYFIAGLNHFINPEFYIPLIPDYLTLKKEVNLISGLIEIALAIGLLLNPTRKIASFLTILMLLAFIPSHIYFIQIGSCIEGGLCVPEWIGWTRLIAIHPALLLWAWKSGRVSSI